MPTAMPGAHQAQEATVVPGCTVDSDLGPGLLPGWSVHPGLLKPGEEPHSTSSAAYCGRALRKGIRSGGQKRGVAWVLDNAGGPAGQQPGGTGARQWKGSCKLQDTDPSQAWVLAGDLLRMASLAPPLTLARLETDRKVGKRSAHLPFSDRRSQEAKGKAQS